MIGILDVSGAVEILLQKEKASKFSKVFLETAVVAAPDLYVSELTNTFWRYYTANILSDKECFEHVQTGIKFISKFINSRELWQEAFSEGIKNKYSIYDMFYMVTTRRYSGVLITNDSALAAVCRKNHVEVCF